MCGLLHFLRRDICVFSAALCALNATTALAGSIETNSRPSSALFAPFRSPPISVEPLGGSATQIQNPHLVQAVKQGQWSAACTIATKTLAQHQHDLDALGIFALCAVFRDDKQSANAALLRLDEAETAPPYYAQLVRGVLQLANDAPGKASAVFKNVLQQRVGDPLALYFEGEALYALGRDAEAASTLKSTLVLWPDHAPALSAVARLTASEDASRGALQSAIAMAEHAAKIEPTNRAYWRQLTDLCDRAGEHSRANAIRLQWLGERSHADRP